jgi:hypothetical protein
MESIAPVVDCVWEAVLMSGRAMGRARTLVALVVVSLQLGCGGADKGDTSAGAVDSDSDDTGCAAPMPVWWPDVDADGHGASTGAVAACEEPAGMVADATDCDDADPTVFPGATEVCDDLDQDCDGVADDGAEDAGVWYLDRDGDGYGDPNLSTAACDAPQGYVSTSDDCDDGDRDVHPSGEDICDELDGDCDGAIERCPGTTIWTSEDAAFTWTGPESYGYAGDRLAVGDLNGDGLDDLLVGAGLTDRTSGGNEGAAYVVYGSTSLAGGVLGTGWPGPESGDRLGSSVATLGDLDGDGLGDALLGCPGDDATDTDAGSAWLIYGASALADGVQQDVRVDGTRLRGAQAHEDAGSAVFGPGDVNGDGFADILVGGPGYDTDEDGESEGAVHLLLGVSGGWVGTVNLATRPTWTGPSARDGVGGLATLGGGDLDGDGLMDLVMGAPGWDATSADDQAGRVWVVLGDTGGWSGTQSFDDADAHLTGPSGVDRAAFGHAVAVVGDTNADGYGDLLVGAPWTETDAADGGAAYVFFGDAAWSAVGAEDADTEVQGDADWGYLGFDVAGLGDADGDGLADMGLGAPGSDDPENAAGAAWFLPGSDAQGVVVVTDLPLVIQGAEADSFLGTSLVGGDLNGDGALHIIVSGTGTDAGAGSVWAFDGWTGER